MSLLRSREFSPVFWTQFYGALNDNILKNAMVILIEYRSVHILGFAPSQMVSIAGGIFILPFFLFSGTAGLLSDAKDKTHLMRIIKWSEVGIMLLATLGFLFEHFAFLLFCLFLMGLHSTFFGPIKYSMLPQILKKEDLLKGTALIECGTFYAILLGTIAGAQLISLPQGPVIASLCLLSVAGLGVWQSLSVPSTPISDPGLKIPLNPIPCLRDSLKLIGESRIVLNSTLLISFFWFFGAALLSVIPAFCKEFLHAGESSVTLCFALFTVGVGLGSAICGWISNDKNKMYLVSLGALGLSILTMDLWFAHSGGSANHAFLLLEMLQQWSFIRVLGDLFGLSLCGGIFIVPLYALLQEKTASQARSRVIAANNVVNSAFMVVAAVLLTLALKWGVSYVTILFLLGLSFMLFNLAIFCNSPEFFPWTTKKNPLFCDEP